MAIKNDTNSLGSNVISMKRSSSVHFLLMWLMIIILAVMGGAFKFEQVSIEYQYQIHISLLNSLYSISLLNNLLGFLLCQSCHRYPSLTSQQHVLR